MIPNVIAEAEPLNRPNLRWREWVRFDRDRADAIPSQPTAAA